MLTGVIHELELVLARLGKLNVPERHALDGTLVSVKEPDLEPAPAELRVPADAIRATRELGSSDCLNLHVPRHLVLLVETNGHREKAIEDRGVGRGVR